MKPERSTQSEKSSGYTISILIPVLNEADSLNELVDEIYATAPRYVSEFEIIFIDDGSRDASWSVITQLAEAKSEVRGIRFRRNFGKAAALTAGMETAKGQLLLMMDADLQDDPAEIPSMLREIEAGADVVNGWKQRRLDPWHKVYPSLVFNWLVGAMTGLKLHDHNCGLKMFRREVADEIHIYGELHRFIAVLAHSRGFQVREVVVNHRSRQHGHSKYGVRRFLRGLLDLLTVTFLTVFGRRPQHALGAVGIGFFGIGMAGLAYLGILWILMHVLNLIPDVKIGDRPLLAYSIASALLGGQALSLGLLAELIVSYSARKSDQFSIRDTTDPKV